MRVTVMNQFTRDLDRRVRVGRLPIMVTELCAPKPFALAEDDNPARGGNNDEQATPVT